MLLTAMSSQKTLFKRIVERVMRHAAPTEATMVTFSACSLATKCAILRRLHFVDDEGFADNPFRPDRIFCEAG